MTISRFFIDRPIFASVLSIIITLSGGIALFGLPIAQYPNITPPTIYVTTSYPGASADFMFASNGIPVPRWTVVVHADLTRLRLTGTIPSDHNMLVAHLRIG